MNIQRMRLETARAWLSFGVGLTEVAAPQRVLRLIGVNRPRHRDIRRMRVNGLRELAATASLMLPGPSRAWFAARVVSSLVELGLLGLVVSRARGGRRRTRVAATAGTLAALTAADILRSTRRRETALTDIGESVTAVMVNASPDQCYAMSSDVESLTRLMHHHGHFDAPYQLRWEVANQRPNRQVTLRAAENPLVQHEATVTFEPAPGGRGTIVRVRMRHRAPVGTAPTKLRKLMGPHPEQWVRESLHRYKHLVELGEARRSGFATVPPLPQQPD